MTHPDHMTTFAPPSPVDEPILVEDETTPLREYSRL